MKYPIFVLFLSVATYWTSAQTSAERVPLTENNLSLLNGAYEIFSSDSSYQFLDQCLTGRAYFNFRKRPGLNDSVVLKAVSGSCLQVTVYKGDSIIGQKKIKGELINGRFAFHATHIIPMVILNGYQKQKNNIGRLTNGDLILDTDFRATAFLVIVPIDGAKERNSNLIFRKKDRI